MAVRKRFVECECGEILTEGKNNQLDGSVLCSPWRLKDSRKRATKSPSQGEILVATFERSVHCGKCKQELMREKRQYELTPPATQADEPVTSYSSREFVMRPPQTLKPPIEDNLLISGVSEGFNLGTTLIQTDGS